VIGLSQRLLTTHNIDTRETSIPPAGFESATLGSERPQTQALNCAATGVGYLVI